MDRNRAERRFCWKISAELKSFKFRMMQMSKQEIYDHAYEIDCMIRIYEELVNISERLETAFCALRRSQMRFRTAALRSITAACC